MKPRVGGRSSERCGGPKTNLRLQAGARRALIEYALADPARETCGLLGGDGNIARHFYPVTNIASQPECRYEMEPAQQIAAMACMRGRGEKLLAIVHSHPKTAAEPSVADIAEANYPDTVYVIVSLTNAKRPVMKGYYLRPGCAPEVVTLHES